MASTSTLAGLAGLRRRLAAARTRPASLRGLSDTATAVSRRASSVFPVLGGLLSPASELGATLAASQAEPSALLRLDLSRCFRRISPRSRAYSATSVSAALEGMHQDPHQRTRNPSSSRSARSRSSRRVDEASSSAASEAASGSERTSDEDVDPARRPRLALSTRQARPGPAAADLLPSSDQAHSPSSRRRSYGSVIRFERPKSIRLDTSRRRTASPPGRLSGSRRATSRSTSFGRGENDELSAAGVKVKFRLIFLALMLLAFVTSLDNTTVYQYVSYATSSFEEHSTLGIIQTAQAIIVAVSRPLVSKESLLIGLGWSFLIAVVLYCAGYAVVAASPSIAVYAVGTLAAQLGNSALVSLQSTAIFTYSASLGNNALLQSILSMPYYITGWVASFIVEGILKTTTWRWGYGMFSILAPTFIFPLLGILFIDQHKKKRSTSLSPYRLGQQGYAVEYKG